MKLLEDNRQTLKSLAAGVIHTTKTSHKKKHNKKNGTDNAIDNIMEEDDDDQTLNESVGDILERILAKEEYKDKRARNMDLDDFLQLLADFNEAGIHFAS
jgi:phosphoglycolate phosphatase-like HAD superfamily hydrolase